MLKDRLLHSLQKRRISWPHFLVDVCSLSVSLYLSLYLRVSLHGMEEYVPDFTKLVWIFLIIKCASLIHFKVYNGIWRYFSTYDATNILKGLATSSLVCITLSYLLSDWAKLPRSILLIDFIISLAFLTGARFFRRMIFEKFQKEISPSQNIHQRTLIYGTDSASRNLHQSIIGNSHSPYQVVGFVTSDKKTWKRTFQGVPVLGDLQMLETLLNSRFASQVIIGEYPTTPETVRHIFDICKPYNIKPLIYHSGGTDTVSVRAIHLEDLLPRQTHDIDLASVSDFIRNKVVLVSGAGGSIGSELSRQIAKLEPKKLILVDHSELNLYDIDSELRSPQVKDSNIVPILADVKNKDLMQKLFSDYAPEIIYHAAAYKHVHLVENNVVSAFENNVLGTLNLLELSHKYNLKKFVLVSTDKAVNPIGTMGATKRLCEIVTSLFAKKYGLNFSSVRFGNVLGSSGSLIPLLKKQIESGYPVTITHADMTRYFMLIPEAVSLVLMSGVISNPGDINVLKMGEPVRILDVAKSLIGLMGRSETEVPILFTGLRPGEKMFEELYLSGKELTTRHPDILTLPDGDAIGQRTLDNVLDEVEKIRKSHFSDAADIKTLLMNLLH